MKSACLRLSVSFLFILLWVLPSGADPGSGASVGISGLVRQTLHLNKTDLEQMQSVEVQLNDIVSDGTFRGVFRYRGVPLRFLLEMAGVAKEESVFRGPGDLAVMVRNASGETALFSWGEILYGKPGDFLLAYAAEPVMPRRDCWKCHEPEVYEERLAPLSRTPVFPKLVVAADQWSDRCIEGISLIKVVDPCPDPPRRKVDPLFSGSLTLIADRGSERIVGRLEGYPRHKLKLDQVGEGRGYHGTMVFEGVPLKDLLSSAGIEPGPGSGVLVSAPDGYQAFFSAGEIFMGRGRDRILLADTRNGAPIEDGGRFLLVTPDDRMAERWVQAVARIERVTLPDVPRLSVVGVGCGDTSLVTRQAVSAMAEADVYVCPPDLREPFGLYMGEKPVLFDLYAFVPPVLRKANPGFSKAQIERLVTEKQEEAAGVIREALDAGKSVCILEYGDPTIWSGWSWVRRFFDPASIRVVPGLSSYNASNALIRADVGCNGAVMMATPWMLLQNPGMVASAGAAGTTLCIFMGLSALDELTPALLKGYPPETPARLVYKAGYAESEHVVPTTVEGLPETARKQEEPYLGLIYVGPCLAGDKRNECPY